MLDQLLNDAKIQMQNARLSSVGHTKGSIDILEILIGLLEHLKRQEKSDVRSLFEDEE